jgi:ParB/RepB/Spo0J family partition protein
VADGLEHEHPVELAAVGERLGALRLCDAHALRAVQDSLARHGQLSPVGVFEQAEGLELLDGFKRLRAARALGWSSLRARVHAADAVEAKLLLMALHQQRGLTEIEEAWLVRSLYRDDKLCQPEIARRLGRHKSWVCRRLALVESLDGEVSAQVRLGLLAPRAAVALAALPRGNQGPASSVVVRHGMTVRQTERWVAELREQPGDAARAATIARRLEAGPAAPDTAAAQRGRPRTDAEWMTADIETMVRVAARLQTRLLATPLEVLGGGAAALVREGLARLLPVLGALGVTAAAAMEQAA